MTHLMKQTMLIVLCKSFTKTCNIRGSLLHNSKTQNPKTTLRNRNHDSLAYKETGHMKHNYCTNAAALSLSIIESENIYHQNTQPIRGPSI